MKKTVFIILYTLLVLGAAYYGYFVYENVMDRKERKEDLAEINRVNYELFNVEIWKREALAIFQKKIKEFEISPSTYTVLDQQVQQYLHQLYNDYFESGELMNMIITNMEKGGKINKMFLNLIKKNVDEQLAQLNLRGQIPGFSKQIIREIKNNEPMLRAYMQKELLRLVLDDTAKEIIDRRSLIYAKYDQNDLAATEILLTKDIDQYDSSIKKQTLWLLSHVLLALILCVWYYRHHFEWSIGGMTIISVILLLLGISLPMIDIDARLNSFVFQLMGEPIDFDEQVIYFQSKSIVEVTKTLWRSGGVDLKAVGTLVFLFSIVFPFFKLLLSACFLFMTRVKKSRLAQGVIFHLGKWSMADVFVVAIFMAYIGMYGVITSQLDMIAGDKNGFVIETINHSELSPGAFYFTAYTILSIIISVLINRWQSKGTYINSL